MVKHPNESRFEFALRLTRALKDNQYAIIHDGENSDGQLGIISKTVLDILYDEIMNPVDPLQEPKIGEWADYSTAPPMEAPVMTWSLATDMVNAAVKQLYANHGYVDKMETEFNEFSPSVMEEAAPKVDHSFVDALSKTIILLREQGAQGKDSDRHWGI